MPTGFIDTVFDANLTALAEQAGYAGSAAANAGLRVWWQPPGLSGSPLDVNAVAAAFSRVAAGVGYATALTSANGSSGDAASLKLQSDHLAAQERAFRVRHMSPVRAAMHAGSRNLGHADAEGVPARVRTFAEDLLAAGSAGFVPRS